MLNAVPTQAQVPQQQTEDDIIAKLKGSFESSTEFNYFIQPLGETKPGSQENFCVIAKIESFLQEHHQCSLLIFGNSGSGKSTLSKYIVWKLWKDYEERRQVPVFIHLPDIDQAKRAKMLLQTSLKYKGLKSEEISELRKNYNLVLVLDGYDEIPEPGNLYLTNSWKDHNIKIITTCRSEIFFEKPNSYKDLFLPEATTILSREQRFVEFHLKKFNAEQIDLYIQKYFESRPNLYFGTQIEDWKVYRKYLNAVPGLIELVKTPFILNKVLDSEILLTIVQEFQDTKIYQRVQMARKNVYDKIVDYWFDKQASRLISQADRIYIQRALGDLKSHFKTYSKNLATRALVDGLQEITMSESESKLLIPSALGYNIDTSEVIKYIRSGCLLKTEENVFSFLHKSLIEYFAAEKVFSGVHLGVDAYDQEFCQDQLSKFGGFNETLLTAEPQIIFTLAEKVIQDMSFKRLLYDVINFSKDQPLVTKAAANAITILNAAGESFNNQDFQKVHISGADLSGATCDKTDFANADLIGVCFKGAWLRETNLKEAKLENIDFGELPTLKSPTEISCLYIDPRGNWLLLKDTYDKLTRWSMATRKNEIIYNFKPESHNSWFNLFSSDEPRITQIAISYDSKWIAVGTTNGVLYLLDADQKEGTRQKKNNSQSDISMILFSPQNEGMIAFGGPSISLQFWNIKTGLFSEPRNKYNIGSNKKLCPNWKFLATLNPKTLEIEEIGTNEDRIFKQFKVNGRGLEFNFSPKGKFLCMLVKTNRNYIQLLNTETWKMDVNCFCLDEAIPSWFSFSFDEQLIAITSSCGLHIWDLESKEHLNDVSYPRVEYKLGHTCRPIFSPKRMVSFCFGNEVFTYDTRRALSSLDSISQVSERRKINVHSTFIKDFLRFGKFSLFLEKILNEITCTLYHPEGKAEKFNFKIKNASDNDLKCLVGPNDHYFVFASVIEYEEDHNSIGIFDLHTCKLVRYLKPQHAIMTMEYGNAHEWLITLGSSVSVWNIETGEIIFEIADTKYSGIAAALTKDDKYLVLADDNETVSIWDTGIQTCQPKYEIKNLGVVIERLFFDSETNLMGYTKTDEKLLFRLNHDDNNVSLNLEKTSSFLNCTGVKLDNAHGLSQLNFDLFLQKGATGQPSKTNHVVLQSEAKIALQYTYAEKENIKINIYSRANPTICITYDNWIVSIMRKPDSSVPDHVFLVIEGVNQFGKAFFIRYDLVYDEKAHKDGISRIEESAYYDIDSEERAKKFDELLNPYKKTTERPTIFRKTWSVPRKKIHDLITDINKDKTKPIKYKLSGDKNIFTKSISGEGHNCFTWAREKLYNLDDKRIKDSLPPKLTDFIAAKPSFYIGPTDN